MQEREPDQFRLLSNIDMVEMKVIQKYQIEISFIQQRSKHVIVGEPKLRIVQKHTFFAPERYTAGILYTDSLNSA